ncbi:phage holin [Alicyclobacillus sp. SO9]|uniref:phage holin n=1 Tax=Alicyclobacillus sp. SO9 TaxID=2665646 RepID=UPI0018E88738|nr:phage holin [Alicyclobacillus sp. SO9]QQE79366.1 phage holin [Alicyclobacillus sp. SO9]
MDMHVFDPVISQVLTNLIQLAAMLVFAGLATLWKTVRHYLKAHLSAKQIQVLQFLGQEAYSLIESQYKTLGGAAKLDKALLYVEEQAKIHKIPFQADAARAAIEQGWMTMEGQYKKRVSN